MVLTILVSAFATWVLLFPARAVLRRAGIVDKPNARSSHTLPTVRGGGVAIVATLCGALLYVAFDGWREGGPGHWRFPGVLLAVATLSVVSFVDDIRGLPARLRFAVQLAAAAVAVLLFRQADWSPLAVVIALVGGLWIAGYTNAFNFMDGINGIAGLQSLTTGLGTALIARELGIPSDSELVVVALAIAGAALGFLPHNFPNAKVFMGDVSSATLGFMLAALAFALGAATSPWVLFWVGLLHANFVLDTGITLVRRASRGERLSQAHREHFYQRLIRAGHSHTFVSLWEAGLQVVAITSLVLATRSAVSTKLAVAAFVVVLWLVFFGFAEREFRKAEKGENAEMRNGKR